MSQTSDTQQLAESTEIPQAILAETPDDVKALQALSLYARRVPIPLISHQLGASRSSTYRLINRGKLLVGVEPGEMLAKILLLGDDLIRQAWLNIQNTEDLTDVPKRVIAEMKSNALNQINQFLMTQVQAVKLLMPKSETTTVRAVSGPGGVGVEVIREKRRLPADIMGEMREKGELTT